MSKQTDRIGRYLQSLTDIRGIIFGLAVLHLIVTQIWVARWYQKFGQDPVDIYPDSFLNVPLLLVLASIALLIGRWWSHVLALAISGWVLYWLGYAGLRAVASAHDVPVFSSVSLHFWLAQKYVGQPQEFLQLALALIIMGYMLVFLSRQWSHSRFEKEI